MNCFVYLCIYLDTIWRRAVISMKAFILGNIKSFMSERVVRVINISVDHLKWCWVKYWPGSWPRSLLCNIDISTLHSHVCPLTVVSVSSHPHSSESTLLAEHGKLVLLMDGRTIQTKTRHYLRINSPQWVDNNSSRLTKG